MENNNHKIKAKRKLELKTAFKGIDREKLASDLSKLRKKHITRNSIDQIATGFQRVSPERAADIENLTAGKVRARILRPDVFDRVIH